MPWYVYRETNVALNATFRFSWAKTGSLRFFLLKTKLWNKYNAFRTHRKHIPLPPPPRGDGCAYRMRHNNVGVFRSIAFSLYIQIGASIGRTSDNPSYKTKTPAGTYQSNIEDILNVNEHDVTLVTTMPIYNHNQRSLDFSYLQKRLYYRVFRTQNAAPPPPRTGLVTHMIDR